MFRSPVETLDDSLMEAISYVANALAPRLFMRGYDVALKSFYQTPRAGGTVGCGEIGSDLLCLSPASQLGTHRTADSFR
jgi:hypothetical protein